MTTEDLLKPRYKVIADYPESCFKIEEILQPTNTNGVDDYYYYPREYRCNEISISLNRYPNIFKKLEWWEDRSIEVLRSVKFVKVIEYQGYWRVGDIVPSKFVYQEDKPFGYNLGQWNDHFHPVYKILPSTQQEYETFKKN